VSLLIESRAMKKRRHWIIEGNILTVLYGTAESLLKTKCIAERFVLWLLMREAHVSMYYNKS
jgi:hypothetical protein